MASTSKKQLARKARHQRLRKKVFGARERPRLCVFRSLRHIYAQLIDDAAGCTLAAASTLEKQAQEGLSSGATCEAARWVGKTLAQRALKLGLKRAIFDRGGYLYHGRVKAVAEAAREAGLEF